MRIDQYKKLKQYNISECYAHFPVQSNCRLITIVNITIDFAIGLIDKMHESQE